MAFDEDKQIEELVQLYRRSFDEILRLIAEENNLKSLKDEVYKILQTTDEEAQKIIIIAVSVVYSFYAARTDQYLSGLGLTKVNRANHQREIDILAQNLLGNLRDASQFVGRRVNDIFRRVQLYEAMKKFQNSLTIQQMKQNVINEILNHGQTAFVDRLGRQWRLDTYAAMVARTVTREAATVAVLNECKEFGVDLVRVSSHFPTCHICALYQGKVFSISGNDDRYPRLTRRPPFHPNCRHVLSPYIRELDPNAEEVQKKSNEKIDESKDIRSEKEKQAYKEMRDKATIETMRQRARQVLLNDTTIEEKQKAIQTLKKSYEKTNSKPRGLDASLLNQYANLLSRE